MAIKVEMEAARVGNAESAKEKKTENMSAQERLEMLEMILDKLPFEIWYKNTAGEYLYVNKGFADNIGKKPEDCIGQKDIDVFGETEATQYRQGDWEFLLGGDDNAQQYKTTDGRMTMEFKAAVDNEIGRRSGIVGCDIESKLGEIQKLLMADARSAFRTVFERSPLGMAIYVNENPVPTDVNEKFCELLGISKYSALNTDWRFLTHPDDIEKNEKVLEKFKAGEIDSFDLEKRFLHSSGRPVPTKIRVHRLISDANSPVVNLCIVEELK
ncbi:MAG: PAS domain S-box protein [Firmicutes bacterium]|nr:PAS domain S-box protein [Bacillota bacterium]